MNDQTIPAAARPCPRPALLDRLTRGPDVIGIVHWGLNTFTGREWGLGDEDPSLLAPSAFDADQIVGACKAGGLGGLVVVAKHHDGFCLWPTRTTDHNVARSPFRGGRGDYVREMADACRRAGLAFGVYCSPWDRNNAGYGTPAYAETYHAQLRELLGGAYGEVFETWFDGANGGDGFYGGARETRRIGDTSAYYRFDEVFRMVRALQPKATIFAGECDESDFRWPGNEMGELDPDARATIETVGGFADGRYGNPRYREQINAGSPGGAFFRACECDFPLRKGWFWRESERGTTKSGETLARLYLGTVGNGGTMNVGIAPDATGRLDEEDVRALARFGELRRALFAEPVESGPANLVELREDVSRGERIDGWRLVCGAREIARGRSVGVRRIRVFPDGEIPDAAALRAEATAFAGPEAPAIRVAAYRADPALLREVLSAAAPTGETDTANWMTGASGTILIAVFGGSFSCRPASRVAKEAWERAFDAEVVDFGIGGTGFVAGAESGSDVPSQIRLALEDARPFRAFILWASTNDIHDHAVAEQNAALERCVAEIRAGAPGAAVALFSSMPWPLDPAKNAVLARFVQGQVETCARLGVPCLDLFRGSGITAENARLFTEADGLHPNEAGYARVKDLQVGFLRGILPPPRPASPAR